MLSYVRREIKQCTSGTSSSGAAITPRYTTDYPLRRFVLDCVLKRVG